MKKKSKKSSNRCKPLEQTQAAALAKLLIGQLDRDSRGTGRKQRITAPAGAVMLSDKTHSGRSALLHNIHV